MCVPGCLCAAHASRPPSPAAAGGGRASGSPLVCHQRRVAIAVGRVRAAPSPRRVRDAPPRMRERATALAERVIRTAFASVAADIDGDEPLRAVAARLAAIGQRIRPFLRLAPTLRPEVRDAGRPDRPRLAGRYMP
jgi:hypothetical protein